MTDLTEHIIDWADPTTSYFWESARNHQLAIQQCSDCRAYQFYPRPFCLSCDSDEVHWVQATGSGTVYSLTTVHLPADPSLMLSVPYVVAVVELQEGPRMLTNLVGDGLRIGSDVQVLWRERPGQAPVPIFGPVD